MKNNEKVMLIVGVAVIILIFSAIKSDINVVSKTISGSWDLSSEVAKNNMEQYLKETPDFDYSNQKVYKLAQQIKEGTDNPYDAVKMAAKYTYDNIKYNSKISISYCYDETASKVLETGSGDCVSMSRLNVALLRAMGIPSQTVGGCLSSVHRCSALFALYPDTWAQTTDMVEGDFKKRGFLHEWVEVYLPEMGWIVVESTSGQVFKQNCDAYIFFSYDTNKFERCVISSSEFWSTCAKGGSI